MREMMLVHEAARILGVTPETIRAMENTGRLHAVRISGVRVFARRDVERIVVERERRRASRERKTVVVK